jgi:hypothetical protein
LRATLIGKSDYKLLKAIDSTLARERERERERKGSAKEIEQGYSTLWFEHT